MNVVDRAAELRRRAVAVGAGGKPVRAARMLHRALELLPAERAAAGARAVRARILVSLAYTEAEQGRVEEGMAILDEAQRLATGLDDPALHGSLHIQRGSILVRRGRMPEALRHLDEAVRVLDGESEELCATLLNRGALHLYSGNLVAADADLRLCIAAAARNGLDVLYAKAQFNLGHLAYLRGDLPAALRGADAALRAPALLASSFRAVFMGGRAEALRAAGLTREADADLAEAVRILRRERLTHDLAEALLARAQVALLDGRWDDALRLARSARRQFLRRGNAAWGDLAELLALQARLGRLDVARLDVARLDGARLDGARSGAARSGAARSGAAQPGGARFARGRGLRAVSAAASALAARLRTSRLDEDARVAVLVAAQALIAAGDPASAEAALAGTAAVPAAATRLAAGDRIGTRLLVRLVRAELAGARGDRATREAQLRGGLADVLRYQSRFGSLDLQTASALHGRRLAALGLADAVRDGRPSVVFAWSERARALTARLPPVRPPGDSRAAELLADLRGVRTALRAAELAGQRVAELRRRRALLERQVRQRAWFAAGTAEAAGTAGMPAGPGPGGVERPARLAAVRAALAEAGGTLVAYLAVGGVLHALVVRPAAARLLVLGPLAVVTGTLQRVRADLDAAALALLPGPMRSVVARSLAGGLTRLADALWRPLAPVAGGGPVVVVPTAALGAVPWTQLPGVRGRPLTVVPSATWWLAARARSTAGGPPVFAVGPGVPRGEAEVRAAAAAWRLPTPTPAPACPPVAEAVLDVSGQNLAGVSGVSGFASVPGVPDVSGFAGVPGVPGRDGASPEPVVLTGAAAASGAVLAAAERARLLHVAAHGVHEPDNPLFSSIQLADGPLFGYDLPRAAALPPHVVLSACDLGLAEVRPGDEALGMTSALLHGGVASVVAGVARVGDDVAGTAMVAYHSALAAGGRPADALAAALAGVDPATPAPLVCFGAGW